MPYNVVYIPSHYYCLCTCTRSIFPCTYSKEDGNKDLLLRQAIASGQSEFVEKSLAPENPFALKKQAITADDGNNKGSTHPPPHQRHKNGESSALLARLKLKEHTTTTINGNRTQPDSGERENSAGSLDFSNNSSASKGNKSSLLYSMLSNGRHSPTKKANSVKSDNDGGSTTSLNSVRVDEAMIENSPPLLQQTDMPPASSSRSRSVEIDNGYMMDSATASNESSPYNPLSVQQDEGQGGGGGGGGTGQSARTMSCSDRTMSGSDLGYYSESSSSLRERHTSTFAGYESEYLYDAGTDTSPPGTCNPYSPDYPLSVLSDGSMTSHVSFITASPAESHSQSLFHNPNSVHSSVGSPTYTLPMDECEFNGSMYAQQSPGNQSVNSDHSDLMTPGSVQNGSEVNLRQQWSPGSVALSSPQQQYSPGNAAITTMNGENPGNYGGQRGLAYAKMDPTTMLANNNCATFNPKPSPSGLTQYANGSPPSLLGKHANTASFSSSSSSAGSLLLSEVYVTSVAGR